MIVDTILSASQFRDAFYRMGREHHFSYEGLEALFESFNEISEATGEPYELDVIAICCEFSEYASVEECCKQYGSDKFSTLDDLLYHTYVMELPCGGIVIQDF